MTGKRGKNHKWKTDRKARTQSQVLSDERAKAARRLRMFETERDRRIEAVRALQIVTNELAEYVGQNKAAAIKRAAIRRGEA